MRRGNLPLAALVLAALVAVALSQSLPGFSNFGINDGESCTKTPNAVTCIALVDASSQYDGIELAFQITGTNANKEIVVTPFVTFEATTTPKPFTNQATGDTAVAGTFTLSLAILASNIDVGSGGSVKKVTKIQYTITAPADVFCDYDNMKNNVKNDWEFVNPVLGKKDGTGCNAGTDSTVTAPDPTMKYIYYKPTATPAVDDFLPGKGYPAELTWATATGVTYEITIATPTKRTTGIDDCPFVTQYKTTSGGTLSDFVFGSSGTVSTTGGTLYLPHLCPNYKYEVTLKACLVANPSDCDSSANEFVPDEVPPTVPAWNTPFSFGSDFVFTPADLSGLETDGTFNRSSYDGGALINKYKLALVLPSSLGDCPRTTTGGGYPTADNFDANGEAENGATDYLIETLLCPGLTYEFKVQACNTAGCSNNATVSITVPVVAPVCGIPLPAPEPFQNPHNAYTTGLYGGSTVQDIRALQALEAKLNATDPTLQLDEVYLNSLGFKTAVVYWPSMSYSGGDDPSLYTYNLTLQRYIKGINGYDNTKYQVFEASYIQIYLLVSFHGASAEAASAAQSGPFPMPGFNYAPTLANNVQPSHCYTMFVELCNSAGCCTPNHFNDLGDLMEGTVSAPWFQPSNTYGRKNSAEPQDRLYCTNLKPWRGPYGKSGSGSLRLTNMWIDAGAAGADASAGVAAGASSSGVAGVAAPAASAGTSNTLLAVAIAVPVGIAGLAVGAIAAAMVITRKQVRDVTIAATTARNANATAMPPASLTEIRTVHVQSNSASGASADSVPAYGV
eukprot:tig00000282_g23841.t1